MGMTPRHAGSCTCVRWLGGMEKDPVQMLGREAEQGEASQGELGSV